MAVESGNLLTAAEIYRLLPLKVGNRSIRILQLSTDQSKPLEGKLKVISLSSYLRSAYVALSYVWGNKDKHNRILCHASTTKSPPAYVSITTNCCDALLQLRRNQASRWPSSSSIDIWVDALCINQDAEEGAEEKLTQIPLMQEIYQKAKAVFIWLGTGTQESDLALEWLTKTSMGREPLSLIKFRAFPTNMLPGEIIRLIRIAPELVRGVYHSWIPKGARKPMDPEHLKDICQREWFSRMWTVQELVMASEPIVICGSKSLRWTPFFWAMVEALEPHSTTNSPLFTKAFNSVVAVTSLWYDLYREEFSQPAVRAWAYAFQPSPLGAIADLFLSYLESWFRVILYIGGFSVTLIVSTQMLRGLRPLDNIWILPPLFLMVLTLLLWPGGPPEEQKNNFRENLIAVLNLSRSKQATLPEDKVYALYGVLKSLRFEVPTPVKGMSFEDVYLDFTRQTIQFLGSMELLRISGSSKSNTMRLENLPSWVPDWRYSYDPISLRYCNATDTSRSKFEFSKSGREIITKGVILDIVDSVTMNSTNIEYAFTTSSNPDLLVPHLIESIDQLYSWIRTVQNIYKSIGRSPSDCIFEVLHSNTTNSMYMSDELHINFLKWFQLLAPDEFSLDEMHGNVLRIAEKVANDDNTLRYHLFLLKLIYGRILLTTKQGYIGTGPLNTEVNDHVFLIPGCSLPGIFRTREETGYTVVGAAHIHGVMEGKAWKTLEDRVQDIVLL